MQFGGLAGNPADQPDVEFVVAVQPGEPAVVGRDADRRDERVVNDLAERAQRLQIVATCNAYQRHTGLATRFRAYGWQRHNLC